MTTLQSNGYPIGFLSQAAEQATQQGVSTEKEWLSTIVLLYRRSTSEALRRVLNLSQFRVALKAHNTIGSKLVRLKTPRLKLEKSNCVYKIQCKDCEAEYIGQTSRPLGVPISEHRRCGKRKPKTC